MLQDSVYFLPHADRDIQIGLHQNQTDADQASESGNVQQASELNHVQNHVHL